MNIFNEALVNEYCEAVQCPSVKIHLKAGDCFKCQVVDFQNEPYTTYLRVVEVLTEGLVLIQKICISTGGCLFIAHREVASDCEAIDEGWQAINEEIWRNNAKHILAAAMVAFSK